MIEQFHFLRPAWLLTLAPLALLLWWFARRRFDASNWRSVIDPRLLPHLLTADGNGRRSRLPWLLAPAAILAIVALAGPTWEQMPQPAYRQQAALVILLDLSRSMDTADLKPSRIVRARHKIADLLALRREGQTALVVFAAAAFTVTPLTSDVDTIVNLLPVLESNLMPTQGSRADHAVSRAFELFDNNAVTQGDLLLISDGIAAGEADAIARLLSDRPQLRLSVLAVGTPDGGPIPLDNGGFVQDRDGAIVIAGLGAAQLRRVAQQGNGVYTAISASDVDVNALTHLFESGYDANTASRSDRVADLWRELGPWLLLPVLPLTAIAFRRGLIWLLPLSLLLLPPAARAIDWQQLWLNDDQRAKQLLDSGDATGAANQFDDAAWRASAQYRAGDYAAALDAWQRQVSENAQYNRGNALAQLGRYDEALAAYAALLEQNPAHADARFNKAAIEEWLKQQQPPQGDGEQSGDRGAQPDSQAGSSRADPQSSAAPQDQSESAEAPAQASGEQAAAPPQAGPADENAAEPESSPMQRSQGGSEPRSNEIDQQMTAQAAEQWLRKVPDDPGGLLRRKFRYQYRQRGGIDIEREPW